jgi:hypothetical protein
MRPTSRPPSGGHSIGTGLVLLAVGGVLAFAVEPPAEVEKYVDVIDLGLILAWTGAAVLLLQVWLYKPRRRRRAREDRTDQWYEHDVHRPGYAGQTRQLPTVRERDDI